MRPSIPFVEVGLLVTTMEVEQKGEATIAYGSCTYLSDTSEEPFNEPQPTKLQPASSISLTQSVELYNNPVSNDNLTFTKSKIRSDEELLLAEKGCWTGLHLPVLLLALALSVAGSIVLVYLWTSSREAPFDYAMIFDAGSTHTEMVIYKWQADKFKGTGVVSQVHSCDMKGGIGVELRRNPSKAPEYLRGCVAEGLAKIPEGRRSHSPVFLAATAGMRLVQSESPEAAQQILGNVSRALEKEAQGMLLSANGVRVISGQEEAVAGWISANYLLQTIYPKPNKMVGMLDMGGASTQVTFVRHGDSPPSMFDTGLRLYGATHELYSRSYMCFGQEQQLNRYLLLLVMDQINSSGSQEPTLGPFNVSSPCHNDGYAETVSYRDYVNVCSETSNSNKLKNMTISLKGSSDPEKCNQYVRKLFDHDHCRRTFTSNECFSAPTAHSTETSFVAVSGFYYVMYYLDFLKSRPSIEEFLAAVQRRCTMTWEDVIKLQPDLLAEYTSKVCFNSQHMSVLLFQGYGITTNTWENMDFLKKVNGTSVGWTLGFTIRTTNAFPEEASVEPFSTAIFISVMFLLVFCIGVSLTLVIRLTAKKYCCKNFL